MKRTCSKIIKGLAIELAPDFSIECERCANDPRTLVCFKWYDSDAADRPMVYHMRVEDVDAYFKNTKKVIGDVADVYKWHMREMYRDAEKWREHLTEEAHRNAGGI